MPDRRRYQRRGFLLTLAVMVALIILLLAIVLGRYAVVEMRQEKLAAYDSLAHQVLESARDWSRLHAADLDESAWRMLSIDELLTPGITGAIELRRCPAAEGQGWIECRLKLHRATGDLSREARWPAVLPTADAATP